MQATHTIHAVYVATFVSVMFINYVLRLFRKGAVTGMYIKIYITCNVVTPPYDVKSTYVMIYLVMYLSYVTTMIVTLYS